MSRQVSLDVGSLLPHESSVYDAHIKPFTIANSRADMGCFAISKFRDGDVIRYYYGTLVYQFMVDVLNACGFHGEYFMAVTREQFYSSALGLSKEA